MFESILKENYLLDPSVNGSVTLHTTRPVTQETVLPIVEAVLEQNGAALIRDEGMYKILPLGEAASAANEANTMSMAPGVLYIATSFATLTHTFIAREVTALRNLGVRVDLLALRPESTLVADNPECDLSGCQYIYPVTWWQLLAQNGRFLVKRPGRYLHALRKTAVLEPLAQRRLEELVDRWILDPSSFIGPGDDMSTLYETGRN